MTPSQAKRVAAARKALAELAAGYFYDGPGNKFQLTPLLKARREVLIDAELEEALMDSTPPEHYKDVKSEPARVEPKNPAASAPMLTEEEIEEWFASETSTLHPSDDFEGPRLKLITSLRDMALRCLQVERKLAEARPSAEAHQFAFNLIHLDHHLGRQEMLTMARELLRIAKVTG